MTFRILITASRDWDNEELIHHILNEYAWMSNVVLVSGGCPSGGDWICENHARAIGWTVEVHPAEWKKHGKKAGFVRNSEMVNAGANRCFAFIKNESKGATMTANMAIKAGIETRIFRE